MLEGDFFPQGGVSVEFAIVDGVAVIEGDIVIPLNRNKMGGSSSLMSMESASDSGMVARSSSRWTNGVIPFVLASDLDNPDRVKLAVAHWNDNTSIKLVERTNERDYVEFVRDPGRCASPIGKLGGRQQIYLSSRCSTGSIIHEIGHTVGLFHEQSRNDRDSHIEILTDNIKEGLEFNFRAMGTKGMNVGEYDYDSIMHYDSFAFSKNGDPTIVKRSDKSLIRAQRDGLSAGDLASVEKYYGN